MNVKATVCGLIFSIAPYGAASAETVKCTRAAAAAAETQPRPETWAALYRSYGRYAQCDDGSVAEAWSDFVATLLAEHWGSLPELDALAKAHSSFGKFVLRHIDVTMSLDQADAIRRSARDNCPADARSLCERILRRVSFPK